MASSDKQTDVLLVVPTLGRRLPFLRESLSSVRSQDVASDVVIVTPSNGEEIRNLAREFDAHVLPDPGSLPDAINYGIAERLTTHAFVGWLNDDDLLEPGSLRATTTALRDQHDAVVAFGACRYIDQQSQSLWVSRAGPWAPRILGWGPDLVPQPGMLVLASAWQEVGGLDPSFSLAFDLDLLLRVRKLGRLIDTGHIVSSFRWHPQSLTVDDRATNIAESERAKRAALRPGLRRFAWMWEPPVRWATRLAVREVNRRARRLGAG